MYTALCLPKDDYSKDGFLTEEEAEAYVVENHCCEECSREGFWSACGAEWLILKTDEFSMCVCVSDIFGVAGLEKVDD